MDTEQLTKTVRTALEHQGMTESELAQHLGISAGGMSKAFSRNSLLKHVDAIAAFLEVPVTALAGDGSGKPPIALIATKDKPHKPDYKLTGGCLLAPLAHASVGVYAQRGRWATLAAPLTRPEVGDIVAYDDPMLGWKLRTFQRDASGANVVLTSPGDGAPEVYPNAHVPALRCVLMIGDRMGVR